MFCSCVCIRLCLSFDFIASCNNIVTLDVENKQPATIRPHDIHVGELMFYHWLFSFFFLRIFVSYTRSSLNSTQPKPGTCLKSGVSPSLTNRRPQNHLVSTISQLKTTSTAYTFGTKHDIHRWARALRTTRVSYIVSKRHELWSTKGFKLWVFTHLP